MADLPKVNPVTIVMDAEKYYDFDPSSFQRVLPTLKTVGGGIADILLPQDATDVAMYAVPPVAVYNKVQKILNRAEALKAQARSIYNYVSEFGGSSKQAKIFEKEAKKLIDDIPKKDRKIHDDYEKSLMGTKESNKRAADKARRIAAGEEKPDTGITRLSGSIAPKPSKKVSNTPFKKVTPENYNSLFGGFQKDAVLLSYPKYAALKGKKIDIVDMKPDEYIKKSAKFFGTTPKSLEKGRIENIEGYGGQELIDKLKNSMKQIMEGKKVKFGNEEYDGFAPVALYAYKQQEGLHRAIAAKQLGIKKIPVIVEKNIKRVDQGAGYNYFKEADRVDYKKGGSVDKSLYFNQKYI